MDAIIVNSFYAIVSYLIKLCALLSQWWRLWGVCIETETKAWKYSWKQKMLYSSGQALILLDDSIMESLVWTGYS